MKHYFLTDNSGAPLKIESLSIAHEEIKHAWTYETEEQMMKVFNEKVKVLNGNHYSSFWLIKFIGLVILCCFAFIGFETTIRALYVDVVNDMPPITQTEYDAFSEYDSTGVGEAE